MDIWRLIIHPPYPGAWNMAVDEALSESVARKKQPPTLRLYDWYPFALSLGQAQPFADVDVTALEKNGWDVVRRPTGGRAILHADELTYSICAPEEDEHVSGNILESYRRLSTGLLRTLELAGIHADSRPKDQTDKTANANPVCFQYPSDYEITCQGKKLIGSAQARRAGGILQHGALPLNGDITRIVNVLAFNDDTKRQEACTRLIERATTVEKILGQSIGWQDMAERMVFGFEDALQITLQPGNLSLEEKQRAFMLLNEKYANPQWTERL